MKLRLATKGFMREKALFLVLCAMGLTANVYGKHAAPPDTLSLRELLSKGEEYEKQYDTYHALLCYEAALRLDSALSTVRKVAQCRYKRGHYRDCIRTLAVLDKDSVNHQDMRMRYNCYSSLDSRDSAVYWGNAISESYPYDSEVIARMASHYNAMELPDSALRYTQRYKERDSTNIFVNRQQAFAFYQKGAYADALDEYRKLLSMKDDEASVYYYAGLCYAKCDSVEQAYDHLLKAARLQEFNNPHVVSQLGVVCIDYGLPDEGIAYIQKAMSLFKPNEQLMFTLTNTLAGAYFKKHKYDECVQYLKEALAYNENSVYTLYKLAQVYGVMENTPLESTYYRRFVEKAEKKEDVRVSLSKFIESAKERIKEIREEEFFQGKN